MSLQTHTKMYRQTLKYGSSAIGTFVSADYIHSSSEAGCRWKCRSLSIMNFVFFPLLFVCLFVAWLYPLITRAWLVADLTLLIRLAPIINAPPKQKHFPNNQCWGWNSSMMQCKPVGQPAHIVIQSANISYMDIYIYAYISFMGTRSLRARWAPTSS